MILNKYKNFNIITAFALAILILITSNGVNIYEHICKTDKIHELSLSKSRHCDDKTVSPCCKKHKSLKSHYTRNCCTNTQHFCKTDVFNPLTKEISKKDKLNDNSNLLLYLPLQLFLQLNAYPSTVSKTAVPNSAINSKVYFRKLNIMRC